MLTAINYEQEVLNQAQVRRATVEFTTIVNDLWYDKSIELILFRNTLVNKHANEVLNLIKLTDNSCSAGISALPLSDYVCIQLYICQIKKKNT